MTEVTTHIQTLSDGTQIHTRSETRRAMDEDGRDRTEMLTDQNDGNANGQVSINDPVAHLRIQLFQNRKVAQIWHTDARPASENEKDKARMEIMRAFNKAIQPTPEEIQGTTKYYASPSCSNEEREPQTFEGMPVKVTRTTCMFPAGFQGSDRETRRIMEFWTLPELGITVHSVEDDPRMGHAEMNVVDFKRGPPDPALFRIPEDYQVFDFSNM